MLGVGSTFVSVVTGIVVALGSARSLILARGVRWWALAECREEGMLIRGRGDEVPEWELGIHVVRHNGLFDGINRERCCLGWWFWRLCESGDQVEVNYDVEEMK
jgi:hypothetical protein